jgi:hypothetical protein
MARDEPRGLDLVTVVQPEQPWSTYLAGEKTARDVERRVLTPVGADPAGDRVNIYPKPAKNFLVGGSHGSSPRPVGSTDQLEAATIGTGHRVDKN